MKPLETELPGEPIPAPPAPHQFARAVLSQLARRGASEAGLRLAAQLFDVAPCPVCDFVIQHCRCKSRLERDHDAIVARHPVD